MLELLDNIVWHSLAGSHRMHSAGTDRTRRYAAGFSPIIGFRDVESPAFSDLDSHCSSGEEFYTDAWSGAIPTGWELIKESTMFKMVWEGGAPADSANGIMQLGPEHADQALALANLTRPGPFGIRTIELGDYFGYFDGDRLIAMAGERFQAGSLREISGVCTHPDYQGRGLARKLMNLLIQRHMKRGETSCLHVMRDNVIAHNLYERMGFRDYKESVVRVVEKIG